MNCSVSTAIVTQRVLNLFRISGFLNNLKQIKAMNLSSVSEKKQSFFGLPARNRLLIKKSIIQSIMRIGIVTITLFIATSVQLLVASPLKSQPIDEVNIYIGLSNETLVQAFKKIEAQSPFHFMYRNDEVKNIRNLKVKSSKQTVEEFLKTILIGTSLTYRQVNNQVLIMPVNYSNQNLNALLISEHKRLEYAPVANIVKGKVTNVRSEPLAGVSVTVKGTTTGTSTDASGNYSIDAPAYGTLVFSYVGFATREMPVNGRSSVDVVLEESVSALDQVVVVGYGTQKKKDITGSVAVVDMKALKSIPAGSATQALQGQAAGVDIINSGVPGGQSNVFIRGVSSFGNTTPLVLVDGVQASLNDIDAENIESMQVLKDAGAASVYGVRGSNGVIIITTKKGKSGAPVFQYNGYYGVQEPLSGNPFKLVTPAEYAKLYGIVNPTSELFSRGALPDYTYSAYNNKGVAMEGDPKVDPSLYNLDIGNLANTYVIQKFNKKGTDWFHEIFKQAPMQNHTITTTGGTDKSNYLFSLGYLDQQGTLIETFLKRYSARINTQFNINKNIRLGQNAYIFYKEDRPFGGLTDASGGNVIAMAFRTFSFIPPYDIAGNYAGGFGGPDLGNSRQPFAYQKQQADNKYSYWDIIGNVFGEVDLLQHVKLRTSLGGSFENRYQFLFVPTPYYNSEANTTPNKLTEISGYSNNIIWTNTATYSNDFGNHRLNLLVGSEAVKSNGRTINGSSSSFFTDDPNYLILGNGTMSITNSSSANVTTLFSLFTRLDYSFTDKYLFGVTVRRDGSSVFGANKRFGVFPSASIGWRVSNESFLRDVSWINDLKLRGSYGILGSQNNISSGNAFTRFSSGRGSSYYDINGTSNSIVPGFYQSAIGNPNTGWEKDKVMNIGMDATIIDYKFNVSVDVYEKSISGLLFTLPLPSTVGGATPPVVNIGDIRNRGVDINLEYNGEISKGLKFFVKGSISHYKNMIVNVPGTGYFDAAGTRFGNVVRNQVGHPVSAFFGYKVIGLFKDAEDVQKSPIQTSAAPGRFKYMDLDGDGKITTDDRTFFGDPNPDFTYGLNLTFNYKNFDLSAMFYGSQGNDIINTTRWYTDFFGSFPSMKRKVLLDAWTPTNTDSKIPIVEGNSSFSTNSVPNSYFMEDGSYLKLRSLILGYNFPNTTISKIGLNKLRIYIQAVNLFTLTKYTGLNPELYGNTSSFGLDFGNYPSNQRQWTFGVNLSF